MIVFCIKGECHKGYTIVNYDYSVVLIKKCQNYYSRAVVYNHSVHTGYSPNVPLRY